MRWVFERMKCFWEEKVLFDKYVYIRVHAMNGKYDTKKKMEENQFELLEYVINLLIQLLNTLLGSSPIKTHLSSFFHYFWLSTWDQKLGCTWCTQLSKSVSICRWKLVWERYTDSHDGRLGTVMLNEVRPTSLWHRLVFIFKPVPTASYCCTNM